MGETVKDDIDIIHAAMSGDRQTVLKDQLERIDREITQRLAINITTRHAVHELIMELRNDIISLDPPHEGAPDDIGARHERLVLKRELRALTVRLMDEQRACWTDKQTLHTEARLVEKELLTQRLRDRRLTDYL